MIPMLLFMQLKLFLSVVLGGMDYSQAYLSFAIEIILVARSKVV